MTGPNLAAASPSLRALALADPRVLDAIAFAQQFTPNDPARFKWVVEYAKQRFAMSQTAYKEMDDKAGAVVGYLGGGTGVLTLGSLAAVTAGQIDPWVVLCAMPSVVFAGLALLAAAVARSTTTWLPPPPTPTAAQYAFDLGDTGEAAFAGHWHLSATLMLPLLERKARWVDRALRLFVASILSLCIPLVASLVGRLTAG